MFIIVFEFVEWVNSMLKRFFVFGIIRYLINDKFVVGFWCMNRVKV